MTSSSSNVETADNNQKEFIQNLSQYKFKKEYKKIIQDMSSNMKRYSIALIVVEVVLVLIGIFRVREILLSGDGESLKKIQEWFMVVWLLTQVIVLFFIIGCTRKTALSFERIFNEGRRKKAEDRRPFFGRILNFHQKLFPLKRKVCTGLALVKDQTQDMENQENPVILALGEMRNLYKLQRRIVVLILMLIPLKIMIDLWDYWKNPHQ